MGACILFLLALPALGGIPEPDQIYYGTVTVDGSDLAIAELLEEQD